MWRSLCILEYLTYSYAVLLYSNLRSAVSWLLCDISICYLQHELKPIASTECPHGWKPLVSHVADGWMVSYSIPWIGDCPHDVPCVPGLLKGYYELRFDER